MREKFEKYFGGLAILIAALFLFAHTQGHDWAFRISVSLMGLCALTGIYYLLSTGKRDRVKNDHERSEDYAKQTVDSQVALMGHFFELATKESEGTYSVRVDTARGELKRIAEVLNSKILFDESYLKQIKSNGEYNSQEVSMIAVSLKIMKDSLKKIRKARWRMRFPLVGKSKAAVTERLKIALQDNIDKHRSIFTEISERDL